MFSAGVVPLSNARVRRVREQQARRERYEAIEQGVGPHLRCRARHRSAKRGDSERTDYSLRIVAHHHCHTIAAAQPETFKRASQTSHPLAQLATGQAHTWRVYMTLGYCRGVGAGDGKAEQALRIAQLHARKKTCMLDVVANADGLNFACNFDIVTPLEKVSPEAPVLSYRELVQSRVIGQRQTSAHLERRSEGAHLRRSNVV